MGILNIDRKIDDMKARVVSWLETMEYGADYTGVYKPSSFYDTNPVSGILLASTYNAINLNTLIGTYNNLEKSVEEEISQFINQFQDDDGYYRISMMKENEVFKTVSPKDTWDYILYHTTNYAMGALCNIGSMPKKDFQFMKPFMSNEYLKEWLDKRDMTDPWLEGNNIVNLASFYAYLNDFCDIDTMDYMRTLLKWHNDNIDNKTGFWGTNHPIKPASLLYGMAGAAHNYHIYYYLNEEIPYNKKVIDYCIDYAKDGIKSACLDVDVVDILVNFIKYDYRKDEILNTLHMLLLKLLDFQNSDGGFSDITEGIRRFDGWVRGYWEPQGISNAFATWFRVSTIAMIQVALDSKKTENWKFRNTLGIGYFKPNYLD